MNSLITQTGFSRTAAGAMFGILATAALVNNYPEEYDQKGPFLPRVVTHSESATTGNLVGLFSGEYSVVDRDMATEIANAYEQFAATQRPLEPEFAKILSENLWDLYAR